MLALTIHNRNRTQIFYNNARKLLTVMRTLRMFRYTINCAFNSTPANGLASLKREENLEAKQLLKRISLMLSAPVQLNYILHTLARANEGNEPEEFTWTGFKLQLLRSIGKRNEMKFSAINKREKCNFISI